MRSFYKILLFSAFLGGCQEQKTSQENAYLGADTFIPSDFTKSLVKEYSKEEMEKVEEDYARLRDFIFKKVVSKKHYVATAGGPGASKSTILETFLQDQKLNYAYIDPDQRGLRYMMSTYLSDMNLYTLSQHSSFAATLEKSYTKWRGASNYIANRLLNEAVDKGYAIAHGTTSTAKVMDKFYETLKKKGYEITLLLCASTDENRFNAIDQRAKVQGFVQSTREDVIKKGEGFFETMPLYFKWADQLYVYWVDDFQKGFVLSATYTQKEGLKIVDEKGFTAFKNAYNTYRHAHSDKKLPQFNDLMRGS